MVKAFARGANAFPISLGVPAHKAALTRSFMVCSRPLAAQACSLRAGRSLFGFERPALLAAQPWSAFRFLVD